MDWHLREQDKHFLSTLWAVIGMVLIWKGVWEGIYEIPYINDPWVILFLGFAMLTLSGLIFKEFDPLGGIDKSVHKVLREVKDHPNKKEFKICYLDKELKKDITVEGHQIRGIEQKHLIVKHGKRKEEVFIPFHRITKVIHKGKTHWRQ